MQGGQACRVLPLLLKLAHHVNGYVGPFGQLLLREIRHAAQARYAVPEMLAHAIEATPAVAGTSAALLTGWDAGPAVGRLREGGARRGRGWQPACVGQAITTP
ncbi:hypothetical protein GCM10023080_098360 [Streptomyces pseudoechinosporeus]